MCGIIGFFGKFTPARLAVFEEMFRFDVMRGKDSAGVALVSKDKVEVVKDTLLPHELMLYTKPYYEKVTKANLKNVLGVIGHNRWGTRGAVTAENAHPFQHEHITLVHNGTVFTYKFPETSRKSTDSETIAHHISVEGIEKTWPMVDGAATLVFWDDKDKTYNMITNGKRPLNFVYTAEKDGMFLASEAWMLHTAMLRVGVAEHREDKVASWYLSPDNLYSFTIQKGKVVFSVKALEGYKEPPVKRQEPWVDRRPQRRPDTNYKSREWNPETNTWVFGVEQHGDFETYPYEDNVVMFTPKGSLGKQAVIKINARNKIISRHDYETYYHNCAACGSNLQSQYAESVIINYDGCEALCKTCVEVGEYDNTPKTQQHTVH